MLPVVTPGMVWYRLGEGSLGLESVDGALSERFETIYGDCAVAAPGPGPQVVCRISAPDAGRVRIRFEDPEPLDEARFVEAIFPGRAGDLTPGGELHASADSEWRPLVANLAVSRLLRLQREIVFFHAASVRIGGRGLMACGPKRSGKTTLALGLAARGHRVLGDEVAALHLADRALVPFRRSLAARAGPRSAAAAALLDRSAGAIETYPDGEQRARVAMRDVSPEAPPARTPLTTVVLLRSIVRTTQVRPSAARRELLGALTPLAASLWDRPPGAIAFHLLGMLSAVRVFEIDAGPPDEVVERIERLMEE